MTTAVFLMSLLGLAGGTYAMRLLGVRLGAMTGASSERGKPPTAQLWMDRATVVLIVGVAVVAAIYDGHDFAGWARLAGVSVGVGAALWRVPMLMAVVIGMAVCGGLRLAGVA